MTANRKQAPVRLVISQLESVSPLRPGECKLDLDEPNATTALERASAWASVNGYADVIPALERFLGREPDDSGFGALINKPNQLVFIITWPWAPATANRPTLPWAE